MSTEQTLQIESISSEATERLGEQLARALKGGEVIELVSDLGGGKTTFVRGLVRGLGSDERVASPTFTISKVYKAGMFEVHHFDFYRLKDAGLAAHELHDLMGEPDVIIIIEWGAVVEHVLPEERITVQFVRTGEDSRRVVVTCPATLARAAAALKGEAV